MTDILSKAGRSRLMAAVRTKSTSLEKQVRSALHRRGFRFRLNVPSLPGAPDIVLPRFSTVIFVNGCFWHHHSNCALATLPTSNRSFWRRKLLQNAARDKRNVRRLRVLGWRVLTTWQCSWSSRARFSREIDRLSRCLTRARGC